MVSDCCAAVLCLLAPFSTSTAYSAAAAAGWCSWSSAPSDRAVSQAESSGLLSSTPTRVPCFLSSCANDTCLCVVCGVVVRLSLSVSLYLSVCLVPRVSCLVSRVSCLFLSVSLSLCLCLCLCFFCQMLLQCAHILKAIKWELLVVDEAHR